MTSLTQLECALLVDGFRVAAVVHGRRLEAQRAVQANMVVSVDDGRQFLLGSLFCADVNLVHVFTEGAVGPFRDSVLFGTVRLNAPVGQLVIVEHLAEFPRNVAVPVVTANHRLDCGFP